MKIRGAVLREPNKPYSIEELELDPPKEKEVLIKYSYTGYCHSDLHLLKGEIYRWIKEQFVAWSVGQVTDTLQNVVLAVDIYRL